MRVVNSYEAASETVPLDVISGALGTNRLGTHVRPDMRVDFPCSKLESQSRGSSRAYARPRGLWPSALNFPFRRFTRRVACRSTHHASLSTLNAQPMKPTLATPVLHVVSALCAQKTSQRAMLKSESGVETKTRTDGTSATLPPFNSPCHIETNTGTPTTASRGRDKLATQLGKLGCNR